MSNVLKELVGDLKPANNPNQLIDALPVLVKRLTDLADEIEDIDDEQFYAYKFNLAVEMLLDLPSGIDIAGFDVCMNHEALAECVACTLRSIANFLAKPNRDPSTDKRLVGCLEGFTKLPDDVILTIIRWMIEQNVFVEAAEEEAEKVQKQNRKKNRKEKQNAQEN